MKSIYPFKEMKVGEVREIYSQRRMHAIQSAAHEYGKRVKTKSNETPVFKVSLRDEPASIIGETAYRIERTA